MSKTRISERFEQLRAITAEAERRTNLGGQERRDRAGAGTRQTDAKIVEDISDRHLGGVGRQRRTECQRQLLADRTGYGAGGKLRELVAGRQRTPDR